MSLVDIKCPNCGASIQLDNSRESGDVYKRQLLYTESCEVIVRNITMFEDCFCTVTPCTTTGSGSDDCAILTLFCTCLLYTSRCV